MISKGSLEGVYPGLIMANGARMEGIEADLFFTFFGLDAIRKGRSAKIKVATVGNPGMHLPSLVGVLPGFSALATKMMQRKMEKLDIPPVPEFVELDRRLGRGHLRLQGDRRHVRPDDGRLRPAGRRRHHGRRVLRAGRRRRDRLHVARGWTFTVRRLYLLLDVDAMRRGRSGHPDARRARLSAFVALVLALAFALAADAGVAVRSTSVLNVPQDYATIQAAINAASTGDTVSVAPGTYHERIDNHSKTITIQSTGGAGATTIDGDTEEPSCA